MFEPPMLNLLVDAFQLNDCIKLATFIFATLVILPSESTEICGIIVPAPYVPAVTPVSPNGSSTIPVIRPNASTVNFAELPDPPYSPGSAPDCAKLSVTCPLLPPPSKPVPARTPVMSPCGIAISVTPVTIPLSLTVNCATLPTSPYVPATTPDVPNTGLTSPASNCPAVELNTKACPLVAPDTLTSAKSPTDALPMMLSADAEIVIASSAGSVVIVTPDPSLNVNMSSASSAAKSTCPAT